MSLVYKIARLPLQWPGERTPANKRPKVPFKSIWSETLRKLEREVGMLGGRDVTIAVDVDGSKIRADGMLYADARPTTPAVILAFRNGKGERFEFPCDRFGWWQDNLDAIARVMEDLRRIERYGVRSGRQYDGFKALPASTSQHTMTLDEAVEVVAGHSGFSAIVLTLDAKVFELAMKSARAKTLPDSVGKAGEFETLEKARGIVEAHLRSEGIVT